MFDIKNQNTFLGGQNVHNLIIIGLLIYIIFKLMKKSEESGLLRYSRPRCICGEWTDGSCKNCPDI